MNPLMIVKGLKLFAIVAILGYGLSVLKGCEANRVAERDATIVANANKVSAQANAATLAVANAQLKAITEQRDEAQRQAEQAQRESTERVREVRQLQAEQKAMLEGNKLNEAVRNNRERIEVLANRATRERFDEVEAIFDGT